MAHRVATAAVERAADPGFGEGEPWQVAKLYWTAMPRSVVRQGYEALAEHAESFFGAADPDDVPFAVDDELVTTCVDASGFGEAKMNALAAHHTQITVDGPFFALSNMLGREVLALEYYRLVRGSLGSERDDNGWETDLFAGVELP
jgi:N-acetyl-1-D-myo-inositol-2-amino-2-deoxy-alpha-D-glucopyranoside deacetylase